MEEGYTLRKDPVTGFYEKVKVEEDQPVPVKSCLQPKENVVKYTQKTTKATSK